MGQITKSGSLALAAFAERGTLITSVGALDGNTWFEVKAVATSSTGLPAGWEETGIFKSPDAASASPISLASGDEVYPLTLTQVCKTDASWTAEEGLIDVTDDCQFGYDAAILDGFVSIKGSIGGFSKFDDETGELITGYVNILKRFFDYVTDDSDGTYTLTAKSNEKLLFFLCLNKDAAVGEKQNWLIIPVNLNSLGGGAGLKEAQKRDLAWEKAQGWAGLYERTVGASDATPI